MGLGFIKELFGGSLLDGVKGIIGQFKLSPEKKAELEALFETQKFELAKIEAEYEAKLLDHESRIVETVNATMREEAKSEHWLQWAWRPIVGLTFSGVIINNFILLPYFVNKGLLPVSIPDGIWSTMLVVLGVAAGTRGWEKVTKAKNANGKEANGLPKK